MASPRQEVGRFWLVNARFWTHQKLPRLARRTGTKPSCCFVHPNAEEEVFQEPMQRSLIILTIATVLSASGAVFAQTPPTAEPKSASGIPQANTAPANPPATNPAPAPATPATATPSPTPVVNQKEVPGPTSSVPASNTSSPAPNAPGKTDNPDKSVPPTSAVPSAPQQPQQPQQPKT